MHISTLGSTKVLKFRADSKSTINEDGGSANLSWAIEEWIKSGNLAAFSSLLKKPK